MDVLEDINEFTELITSVNPDMIDWEDKLLLMQEFFIFKEKVEPIYLKYAADLRL